MKDHTNCHVCEYFHYQNHFNRPQRIHTENHDNSALSYQHLHFYTKYQMHVNMTNSLSYIFHTSYCTQDMHNSHMFSNSQCDISSHLHCLKHILTLYANQTAHKPWVSSHIPYRPLVSSSLPGLCTYNNEQRIIKLFIMFIYHTRYWNVTFRMGIALYISIQLDYTCFP